MSNSSNLYADKVFSEHPMVLWALDDNIDYISLISENKRSISSWSKTAGTVSEVDSGLSPFPNSTTSKVTLANPEDEFSVATFKSDDIINFSLMNQDLKTFSIGAYININTSAFAGFELGYEYIDSTTAQTIQNLKYFPTSVTDSWMFISETFDLPDDNTTMKVVIKAVYYSIPELTDPYIFLVNGISIGQWSEEFNSTSLGVTVGAPISGVLRDLTFNGIESLSYGLNKDSAYYVVSNNSLYAKNTGIPMVYGAKGLTRLSPNTNMPSLLIPGNGFLHEHGKFKEYTFEMWLRLTNNSSQPKKIFGPIETDDGLWVDGPFLILKINDYVASHYVGEWGKPMLVDIRYSYNGANLVINGEQVAEILFSAKDLSFLLNDGYTTDWLGFWSYNDVSPIEVDAVAIYSYQVPNIVAKRRYVYGQGVDFPENINTAYSGSSVFVDYQYANYASNYIYPDLGRWSQGVLDNISIENNELSAPSYSLPELVIESGAVSDLTDLVFSSNLQLENNNFFTFKPNNVWNKNGHLVFNNFNFLQEEIKAFYSVIKFTSLPEEDEVIIQINSSTNSNYFSIVANGSKIKYNLFYNGNTTTIHENAGVQIGEVFPVGINIDDFTKYFGEHLYSFFGNRSDLKFYVGGNKDFDKSFHGKIYDVGFCNSSNLIEVSELFNAKGCVIEHEDIFDLYTSQIDADSGEYTGSSESFWKFFMDGGNPYSYSSYRLKNHTASYTLIVKEYFNKFYFDIAISGSWKDYLPLTYLAKYVTDTTGSKYYDLDFIQFNVDYPAPSKFLEKESQPIVWNYGNPRSITTDGVTTVIPSLMEEYSTPIQKKYSALDNHLYTGYNDYTDLQNKSFKDYIYDTSSSYVRSYVNFEYVSSGINTNDNYFITTELPPKDGVVSPGSNWLSTKYEVVDNMIIYPPSEDINSLAMVTKLVFKIDGIFTHGVRLKTLEYASQSFNDSSPNPVGTKFGISIYPYRKSGYYYDYKEKNPFSIYKKSSPYLFLTKNSGIELRGNYDPNIDRGLSIPINQSVAESFKIMAMQTAIKYDKDYFPFSPMQIFEIESKDKNIQFFMVANSPDGKRGKLYAVDSTTGKLEDGISFYINGKIVKDPVITIKEWTFLGIGFSSILDFKNTVGSIRLTGPMMFNVLSYYQTTSLQEVQQTSLRPWFKVKYAGVLPLDWNFWNPAYMWQGVLVISTRSYYGVEPDVIYKTYTGTNKTIIDTDDILTLGKYEYNIYQDISWQQTTVIPV